MKQIISGILLSIGIIVFISCEKDTDPRDISYAVKGLSSEYKLTYVINGSNFSSIVYGKDTSISFKADKGEVLYFDVKYKDDVDKMSGFSALITCNKTILKESYAYDMKWADSATTNVPYPFEIILSSTVPY